MPVGTETIIAGQIMVGETTPTIFMAKITATAASTKTSWLDC